MNKNNKLLTSKSKVLLKSYSIWYILFFSVWVGVFFLAQHRSFFTNSDGIYEQYVYFLYVGKWIRQLLKNIFIRHIFELPMWDMSIGMGGDSFVTLSGVANLLADPFCWISAIVPLSVAEYVFDLCIILKLYLAGLAFTFFASEYDADDHGAVAGALVYTFSSTTYVGFGQPNFQWLFILFPLLLIGVNRLWKNTGHRLYVLVLAGSVLYSYYYTYMMGLMIVVYCLIRFFAERKKIIELPKLLLRFVLCSLMGIGIGIGPLIPAIINLSQIDRLNNRFDIGVFAINRLLATVLNCFSQVGLFHDSLWGCSSIFFVCLVLLLVNKRERIVLKILIGLFFLSLAIPYVGSVFNGFSFPTDRYVFGLILLAAYVVALKFKDLNQFRGKIWYISLAISFVYLICAVKISDLSGALSGISLVITVVMVGWYNRGNHSAEKTVLFSYFVLFLSIASISICAFRTLFWYVELGTANDILFESTGADLILDREDLGDIRFDYIPYSYDMEPLNSSMVLDINGYDFYHSNYNNDLDKYYDSLAVISNPIGFSYSGMRGRDYLELLNGSRYLLCYEERTSALDAPYSYAHISSGEEYGLYAASTDTSLVYFYDDLISTDAFDRLTPISREELLMERCVVDMAQDDLVPAPQHTELDFTVSETENVEFTGDDTFTITDKGYMLLEFEPVSEAEISLYLDGINADVSYVVVPSLMCGEEYISADFLGGIDRGNNYYHGKDTLLFNFGYCEETADGIRLAFTVPGNYSLKGINIYSRDAEQLDATIDEFYEHACMDDITYEIDGNHIRISADADKDKYLYIAVPYSEGWTAYVDGEKADIIKANTAFMVIPVSQGEHDVELVYFTPYLKPGLLCSLVSLIGLGIYSFFTGKKKEV